MKKALISSIIALCLLLPFASCDGTLKTSEVTSQQWEQSFNKILIRSNGESSNESDKNGSQSLLTSKTDFETIQDDSGFIAKIASDAKFSAKYGNRSYSSYDAFMADIYTNALVSTKMPQSFASQFSSYFSGQGAGIADVTEYGINFLATPSWSVQYTDNGKPIGYSGENSTGYVPSVMVDHKKGDEIFYAYKIGNSNQWSGWMQDNTGEPIIYDTLSVIIQKLRNSYEDAKLGGYAYEVTYYVKDSNFYSMIGISGESNTELANIDNMLKTQKPDGDGYSPLTCYVKFDNSDEKNVVELQMKCDLNFKQLMMDSFKAMKQANGNGENVDEDSNADGNTQIPGINYENMTDAICEEINKTETCQFEVTEDFRFSYKSKYQYNVPIRTFLD